MFAWYGIPVTLVSDNGPQFSSAEMKEFTEAYGFHHITTCPYYPQANGQAERTVRLKDVCPSDLIGSWYKNNYNLVTISVNTYLHITIQITLFFI